MFKKMNSNLIFSKTGIKILRFLSENHLNNFYEREISRKSGVSIGATNQLLRIFTEASLAKREKRGKMYFYKINLENPIVKQLRILFTVLDIYPLLEEIKPLSERIILFGSCAEGLNMKESDIDIFILTSNKKRVSEKIFHETYKGKRISPVIVEIHKLSEFKKQNKAFYEKIEHGIVLWDKNEL